MGVSGGRQGWSASMLIMASLSCPVHLLLYFCVCFITERGEKRHRTIASTKTNLLVGPVYPGRDASLFQPVHTVIRGGENDVEDGAHESISIRCS
jgi:hypothetical protein